MDFYMYYDVVLDRLEREYLEHGRLIIACDFDDTIFNYFDISGREYSCVIDLLKRWQNHADIIIWTGNGEDKYAEIQSYVDELGIKIYGINCDSKVKTNSRKIYANAYLDDRAGLSIIYCALLILIEKIEDKEI